MAGERLVTIEIPFDTFNMFREQILDHVRKTYGEPPKQKVDHLGTRGEKLDHCIRLNLVSPQPMMWKDVAAACGVTPLTLRRHRARILEKLK